METVKGRSECKISHIAITEHVGFYVVTMTLDLKSGFLIWKFANNLDLDGNVKRRTELIDRMPDYFSCISLRCFVCDEKFNVHPCHQAQKKKELHRGLQP